MMLCSGQCYLLEGCKGMHMKLVLAAAAVVVVTAALALLADLPSGCTCTATGVYFAGTQFRILLPKLSALKFHSKRGLESGS